VTVVKVIVASHSSVIATIAGVCQKHCKASDRSNGFSADKELTQSFGLQRVTSTN